VLELPAHHKLEAILDEYIHGARLAGQKKQPLFRTTQGQKRQLTARRMSQADAWRMIRRRAADAGIKTAIGCHTFRATGITNYLEDDGTLDSIQV
jgi:integrase